MPSRAVTSPRSRPRHTVPVVPRDQVWHHAVSLAALPREEYVRMGGPECDIFGPPPNPAATMRRTAAVALLGEIVLDLARPRWGEHRAHLAGVPTAQRLSEYSDITTVAQATGIHNNLVRELGEKALAEALK